MNTHKSIEEKWQKEAEEMSYIPWDYRYDKEGTERIVKIKDVNTLISQIIADTERVAQQQVQEKVEEIERKAQNKSCSAYFVHQGADYITMENLKKILSPLQSKSLEDVVE